MIIVGCSNSKHLAKSIAKKLNFSYQDLNLDIAPDGELHVRFDDDLKDKSVVLVQSFYPHPNHSLMELLFAASTARDLGARKVILVAPYLAYLKEDKRVIKGECVSTRVVSELLSKNFDAVVTVEPHLHDSQLFTIPIYNVDISELLKDYIKKNFKDAVIIGADNESSKLVNRISFNSIILDKKRKDAFNVSLKGNYNLPEGKEVLIVDDIISTGSSMIEAIKFLKLKKVNCLAVHGVFIGGALRELEKYANKIITTNTISNESSEIDVSNLIAKKLLEV